MFVAIFAYIERIVNMVRPRKMLYMAVGRFTAETKGIDLFVDVRTTGASC